MRATDVLRALLKERLQRQNCARSLSKLKRDEDATKVALVKEISGIGNKRFVADVCFNCKVP